jgi:hypothetical protein
VDIPFALCNCTLLVELMNRVWVRPVYWGAAISSASRTSLVGTAPPCLWASSSVLVLPRGLLRLSGSCCACATMLIDQCRDTVMQCDASTCDEGPIGVACELTVTRVLLRGCCTAVGLSFVLSVWQLETLAPANVCPPCWYHH